MISKKDYAGKYLRGIDYQVATIFGKEGGFNTPATNDERLDNLCEIASRYKLKNRLKVLSDMEKSIGTKLLKNCSLKDNGCLEWDGAKNSGGYGLVHIPGLNINMTAHRLSWSLFFGVIPRKLFVCHKCDNPSCVHPDHLFLGTITDNNRDAAIKRRQRRGEKNLVSPSQEWESEHGLNWQGIKTYSI